MEIYTKLNEIRARAAVAKKIFERYLSSSDTVIGKKRGQSVFTLHEIEDDDYEETKTNNDTLKDKVKPIQSVDSNTKTDYSLINHNNNIQNTLNIENNIIDELKNKFQLQIENPDSNLFDNVLICCFQTSL